MNKVFQPDKLIKSFPLSDYKDEDEGTIAEVWFCYEDNKIYLNFKQDGRYVTHVVWKLTKEDTINLANGLSEATLYMNSLENQNYVVNTLKK